MLLAQSGNPINKMETISTTKISPYYPALQVILLSQVQSASKVKVTNHNGSTISQLQMLQQQLDDAQQRERDVSNDMDKQRFMLQLVANNHLEMSTIIEEVVEHAKTLLEADRVTLFVVDKDRRIVFSLSSGEQLIRCNKGIAGETVRTARPVMIDDAYADARFNRAVDQETGYPDEVNFVTTNRGWH